MQHGREKQYYDGTLLALKTTPTRQYPPLKLANALQTLFQCCRCIPRKCNPDRHRASYLTQSFVITGNRTSATKTSNFKRDTHELLALQQPVGHELPRADGARLVRHGCGVWNPITRDPQRPAAPRKENSTMPSQASFQACSLSHNSFATWLNLFNYTMAH